MRLSSTKGKAVGSLPTSVFASRLGQVVLRFSSVQYIDLPEDVCRVEDEKVFRAKSIMTIEKSHMTP